MRAGDLRQRIEIQRKQVTRDTFGAEEETWGTLATVWAKIDTISGTEAIGSEQVAVATLTHEVTIRWRNDLEPTMQVLWNNRTLTIRAIVDDNLKRQTILSCDEVVASSSGPASTTT